MTGVRLSRSGRQALTGYLFISPWILGFLIFVLGPLVASLWLSFTNYNITSAPSFVGLDNYVYMFTKDPQFWGSVVRTGYYAVVVVVLGLAGSLGCALLLNTGLRGAAFYRTAFFIPSLTPIVATGILWAYLLQPTGGAVNGLLGLLGIPGPGWLDDPNWAIPGLVLIRLWAIVGGTQMIVFLAGLQGIPQELYEAAQMDGANSWQSFLNITLPGLSPTMFFNLVIGIIGALKVFAIVVVTTNGGPARATWVYVLHLYDTGFTNLEMGYASALGWFFFLVVVALTVLQFVGSRRWVHYESA